MAKEAPREAQEEEEAKGAQEEEEEREYQNPKNQKEAKDPRNQQMLMREKKEGWNLIWQTSTERFVTY